MNTRNQFHTGIPIPKALKIVGIIGGSWALLLTLFSTLAYLPDHPDFSIFTTYLSDIGDTPVFPQIFMNSGLLIAAPIRYLIIVLLVLRLRQSGAGRFFTIFALIIGLVSSAGTILMAAAPFSVLPTVHKLGIPLYFLGVVILQTMIGLKELSIKGIPRVLPALSFLLVALYFIFAVLMMLYEQGVVNRSTPVIWEWLAYFSSVAWVFGQSIGLSKKLDN